VHNPFTWQLVLEIRSCGDTAAKPLDQYLAILDAYADHGVVSHWYVVPTVAQERILRAAAVLDVRDLATVWGWPPVAVRRT
jgi:hypothetical protein